MSLLFNPRMCISDDLKEHLRGIAVPILPKDGLYLLRYAGDGTRCAAHFRDAWRLLPASVRSGLLEFWHAGGDINLVCPYIVLNTWWERRDDGVLGECNVTGHLMWLWVPAMECLPDFIVRNVIAHELGHAYLAATGAAPRRTAKEWREYHETPPAYLRDNEEMQVQCKRPPQP